MKKLFYLLLALLAVQSAMAQDPDLPQTEAPVILISLSQNTYSIDVAGTGQLIVELYREFNGVEGENWELIESAQANGTYHYEIMRPDDVADSYRCKVKAVAQEENMLPSEEVTEYFDVHGFFHMPTPTITFIEEEDGLYIDVYGEGQLKVYVQINDNESVEVDQLPFFVPRTYEEQRIYVNALSEGYGEPDVLPSGATAEYTLAAAEIPPPEPMLISAPNIWVEEEGDHVIIHADNTYYSSDPYDPYGEIEVYLFIDGQQVENPCIVWRTSYEQDLGLSAYAVSVNNPDVPPSQWAYTVYIVEPLMKTSTPYFNGYYLENGYAVTLYETEPSTIYCRIGVYDEENGFEFGEWMEYENELFFVDPGKYRIEAYAIADGKMMSEMIAYELVVYPKYIYDFEEDGIFYQITAEGKVSVCAETMDYNSYSGQVNIPAMVTYEGVTYMVTGIDDNAFRDCAGLTGVTIGAYVTAIGNCAFYRCSGLTSVTLGDYVITVGNAAFAACSNLASVTLGSGLASIGSNAFQSCTALTSVTCKAATPPVIAFSSSFECYDTATLHVYPAVLDSYQSADYWKQFTTIVSEDKVAPVAGDANGDGLLNISDVTTLINMLLNRQ